MSGITISGRYVIYLDDCFHPLIERETLARLSMGCEILGCQIAEHFMARATFSCENGRRIWNVVHDCEGGVYHLEIDGKPPDSLDGIRGRFVARQDAAGGEEAEVDLIFDVPIELAAALSGFRHNQSGDSAGRAGSTALEPINA